MSCYSQAVFLLLANVQHLLLKEDNQGKSLPVCGTLHAPPNSLQKSMTKSSSTFAIWPWSATIQGSLLPERVSLAGKRRRSKDSLSSTRRWRVPHTPTTAVFKESWSWLCLRPQAVDAVFNMKPIRVSGQNSFLSSDSCLRNQIFLLPQGRTLLKLPQIQVFCS